MLVKCIKVGYLKCNCYLLIKDNKVLVIDPGDDGEKIVKNLLNMEVVGIVITHHHYDHDSAVSFLYEKYRCMVYDMYNLEEGLNRIDVFSFFVIYTPGHKEDLITLYFPDDKMMFTGDFLFKNTIGRCDLPGSSVKDMKNSIDKIREYDDSVIIYPGHGVSSVLGYEKKNNIYFISDWN